ncbi:MAG: L,D-transpeptidase family protein [Chloroflexota bacterium]
MTPDRSKRSTHVTRRRALASLTGTVAGAIAAATLMPSAAAAQSAQPRWVQTHKESELWSGPSQQAVSFGPIPRLAYLRIEQPQQGNRVYVFNPLNGGRAWIDARDVGPAGEPPAWYANRTPNMHVPARVVGGANVRAEPRVADGNVVDQKLHNEGVEVIGQVKDEGGETWYRVGPVEFIHGSLVRLPNPIATHPGKLMVADLAEPTIVTAYEDGKAVYSALALKGTVDWGTPTGFFTIQRRVANETMNSETLGIPRDGPGGYFLKDVLFTQYFTGDGASIHYNYWSGNFGYRGSHGCLGMNYEDALWFWEWASVGTPLVIRE